MSLTVLTHPILEMDESTKFLKYAKMTGTIVQIIYKKVWCLGLAPLKKGLLVAILLEKNMIQMVPTYCAESLNCIFEIGGN